MNEQLNLPKKGFYYHYKHNPKIDFNNYVYEVIGIGRNTEEKTYTVLYRPIYANDWFSPADAQSRPLEIFNEQVKINGELVPRFKKIEDSELIKKLMEIREKMYNK